MFLVKTIIWTQMKIIGFSRISNGANADKGQSPAHELIDFDTDEDYLE